MPPERQKLLGLSRGKLPLDTATLASLSIPPASVKGTNEAGEKVVSITLIGTPLADTFKDPSGHAASGQVSRAGMHGQHGALRKAWWIYAAHTAMLTSLYHDRTRRTQFQM